MTQETHLGDLGPVDVSATADVDVAHEVRVELTSVTPSLVRLRLAVTAEVDAHLAGFRMDVRLPGGPLAPIVLTHPNLDQESRGDPSGRLATGTVVTRAFDQAIAWDDRALVVSVEHPEQWVTSIDTRADGDEVAITVRQHQRAYRGQPLPVHLPAGVTRWSDPVLLGAWDDPYDGLEQHAARLAEACSPPEPPYVPAPRGWNSWDYYGWVLNEEIVLAESAAMPTEAGYEWMVLTGPWFTAMGDWEPHLERFPRGLARLCDDLRGRGQRMGLWWSPFAVEEDATLFDEDSDWFLRDPAGRLLSGSIFEPGRGSADPSIRRTAILDATHPEVREHLTSTARRLTHEYGARYLFTDFVRLQQHAGAVRHDATATDVQAFRAGMRAILAGLPDDAMVMVASGTVGAYPGVCHAARIGPDITFPALGAPLLLRWTPPGTDAEDGFASRGHPPGVGRTLNSWSGIGGVVGELEAMASRWHLHGRAFQANPDCLMVTGDAAQARRVAEAWAATGGLLLAGDSWLTLDPDRRAILTDPALLARQAEHRADRPVGLFEGDGLRYR